MKNGAKLLYAIGFVFNIISIFILAILIALVGVSLSSQGLIDKIAADTGSTVALVHELLLIMVILLAISATIEFAIIFFVINARKNLTKKTGKVSPHVVLLVSGIVGMNLFYLLGAIFGMTAASHDSEDEDEELDN